MQEIVKKIGFDVETVIFCSPIVKKKNIVNIIGKLFIKDGHTKIFDRICKIIRYSLHRDLENKRIKAFKEFSNKYLLEMFYDYNNETLSYLSNKFDFLLQEATRYGIQYI